MNTDRSATSDYGIHRRLAVMLSALVMVACGGGGSSSGGNGAPAPGVTLSGQAVTNAALAAPAALGRATAASARSIQISAVQPIEGGEVSLYKVYPDGVKEPVDIGAVTTDASGNYEIPNIPIAETGNGLPTDFYYEVRITDDAGMDVRAPVAPGADTTVDVSPSTNLAAHILADVAKVPGQVDLPTPAAELIESMRMMVSEDANTLETNGSIAVPDATVAGNSNVLASANGLASAGGDAEKLYKAVQFHSELITLANDNATTDADAGAYIKRVTREGANQNANGNTLSALAANAMGQALIDDAMFTPTEIIAAYNANNGFDPDAILADKVDQFAELLGGVEDKFTGVEGAPEDLNVENQAALYTMRDLSSDTFDATTPLDADQAVAFLQTLSLNDSDPNSRVGNFGNNVDINAIVSNLTEDDALAEPAIADMQIYHNSGFGCNEGDGKGHFMADVDVYAPGLTVTGVTITSTDGTALGGNGVSLSPAGKRWMSNTDGECVTLGTAVTYTVEATLSDESIVTTTVGRNHPGVPEAMTTVDGNPTSTQMDNPDVFSVKRPVYTWESPETVLASIDDAPAGSQIKYTYEFSHVTVSGLLAGGPLNADTYPSCKAVNSSGSLTMYSVDSFIPTVDCDIEACATDTGEDPGNVICRMNVQTFLVDEYDRLLGQAAGHFPVFRVDSSGSSD